MLEFRVIISSRVPKTKYVKPAVNRQPGYRRETRRAVIFSNSELCHQLITCQDIVELLVQLSLIVLKKVQ